MNAAAPRRLVLRRKRGIASVLRFALFFVAFHSALFLIFDVLPRADFRLGGWMVADPVAAERYRVAVGIDGSTADRYLDSIGRLLSGDFGRSLSGFSIGALFWARLQASLPSLILSLIFIFGFSAAMAMWRCNRHEPKGWRIWRSISFLALTPTLFAAMTVKALLVFLGWDDTLLATRWSEIVLVALTAALVPAALLCSVATDAAATVAIQPHVMTMVAIGMSPTAVKMRLMVNVFVMSRPIMSRAILQLIGGLVFSEIAFDVAGFGRVFMEAFRTSDYLMLHGWMLCVGALVFVCGDFRRFSG